MSVLVWYRQLHCTAALGCNFSLCVNGTFATFYEFEVTKFGPRESNGHVTDDVDDVT